MTGYAISLTAWVKNSSFPTNVAQRFIAKASDATEAGSYWVLGQTSTSGQNRLFFRLKSGNMTRTLAASTGNLPLNAWYHVAATYDGARMRLYLNGAEVGSLKKTGALSRGTGVPLHIGRSPEGSNYMRGAIDDVRVYRSGLSKYEVSRIIELAGSTTTNPPPTVSLSSPASGASYTAGTTISVSATAADANGTIAQRTVLRGFDPDRHGHFKSVQRVVA